MVKPSRTGTADLLRRRVPSSHYLRKTKLVKPSRMETVVSLMRCYGFEQQQGSSAQIASRSRNRADSL